MPEQKHPVYDALLLIGPTGAGKTPLGEHIASVVDLPRRTLHFDFGRELRRVVEQEQPGKIFSAEQLAFLDRVLRTGALLEDEQFPIALNILQVFLTLHRADGRTVLLLNGLPRHEGQARRMQSIVAVRAIIELVLSERDVLARLASNAGGDRASRTDDALELVRHKLQIYRERTSPLIDYYLAQGAVRVPCPIGPATTAAQAWGEIAATIDALLKKLDVDE